MKRVYIILILIYFIMCLFSCAPVRTVTPLKKGEHDVSFSFGGPLIGFAGTTIPIPLTSLSYAHGLTETYTVSGSLHTTALAFGVIQTELGVLRNIWQSEDGFTGVSIAPSMYVMCDVWEWKPKVYPWLDINIYKKYNNNGHIVYFSYSSMFELSSKKAFGEKVNSRYIPFFSLGHQFNYNKWGIKAEAKYINFLQSNQNLAVDYKVPGNKGAMGVFLGVNRKIE